MKVEAYDLDSLRKLVRSLQAENRSLRELLEEMERAGITVALTGSENEHYAVIDKRLVWHGGVNLLGKEDVWDNLIRVESSKAAAELLEMSYKGIAQSAQ